MNFNNITEFALVNIVTYFSFFLHIVAAIISISLVKKTKYNASWILISLGFVLIAIYRYLDLFPVLSDENSKELILYQRWLGLIISVVLVIGVSYIKKIFKFLRDLDVIRDRSEKRVLFAIIKTEENERKRFAKELHDGLGPLLSVVKMLISGISDKNKPEINAKITANARQVVDEAIDAIREISANLSPHILDNFGLKTAINSFVNKLKLVKTIDIFFETNLNNERFNYNIEVILYRVICELINNTLKHADASEIHLKLEKNPDQLVFEYNDNGIGFDESLDIAGSYGMGFDNMVNRLKSVNGTIKFDSNPGEGMNAFVEIKLDM